MENYLGVAWIGPGGVYTMRLPQARHIQCPKTSVRPCNVTYKGSRHVRRPCYAHTRNCGFKWDLDSSLSRLIGLSTREGTTCSSSFVHKNPKCLQYSRGAVVTHVCTPALGFGCAYITSNSQPIISRATSQWLLPNLTVQAASAHARVQKASAIQYSHQVI